MTALTGVQRRLAGNDPFVVGRDSPAWRVDSGSAQVFAVLQDANGRAERLPLFAIHEGDIALPAPDDERWFLLVALEEDTVLTAVAPDESITDEQPDRLAELGYGIESWLDQLADAVLVHSPAEGTRLPAIGPIDVDAGSVVWPQARFAWVTSTAGPDALRLFGEHPFESEDGTAIIPMPAVAWARVDRSTELGVVSSDEALTRPGFWAGVTAYHRAVMASVADRAVARRRVDAEMFERRQRAEDESDRRLYTSLAAVVDPTADGAGISPEGPSGVPPAVQLVAAVHGLELRASPHGTGVGLDEVAAVAEHSGVRWRQIALERRWWRQDLGPMVGMTAADGRLVALLPAAPGKYDLVDPEAGTRLRVGAAQAATLAPEAVMLYRSLPPDSVSGRGVIRFARRAAGSDSWRLLLLASAVGALSLVPPLVTNAVFSTVVPQRETTMLMWLTVMLVVVAFASFAFNIGAQLAAARAAGAVARDLQAAIWDRVLDLPLPFFRGYAPGALATRVMAVDQIQQLANAVVVTSVLALPVGVANLAVAFWLSPRLALFGSVVVGGEVAGMVLLTRAQARHFSAMTASGQASFGVAMGLVDGVGKLRVAHAERRAFAQWGAPFATMKHAFIRGQRGMGVLTSFAAAGTAFGTLALFLAAATLPPDSLSSATFIAFNTAFAQVLTVSLGLAGVAAFVVQARPLYASARPVLETSREVHEAKSDPGDLTGAVEVSHVTFRYAADGPAVLDGVSFSLEPAQFLALVGPSGSGKSSLLRVLLGFETPEVGSVRFDGKDLDGLDVRRVRRQIGVVTQSVRLLPGDIFHNIIGTRPLTLDDAWEAAELAGIADDIRAMPMGMHTFVSEGAATFSGGQRQRLLIARAIAAKPRLLLFDEATSALDNRTQAHVADAIAELRAARIVIAHRLSTIERADSILVLRDGRITQTGTLDELMSRPGDFADLARRQLV